MAGRTRLALTAEQRAQALAWRAEGWSWDRISGHLNVSSTFLARELPDAPSVEGRRHLPGPNRSAGVRSGNLKRLSHIPVSP